MNNDNPTLIAGFNDVIGHIRNQEKRIQELELQNEKLQEYQSISNDYAPNEDKYMNSYGDYIGNPDTLSSYIHKITMENYDLKSKVREMTPEHNEIKEIYADRDKVKQENKKLNKQIKEVRKQIEDTEKLNKKLNEENIQCRKEIEVIRKSVEEECQASGIMEVMNIRIEEAEKEVEEYKLKLMKKQEDVDFHFNSYMKLRHVLEFKNYRECGCCGNWSNEDEIEEDAIDADCDDIDICFHCRDEYFTQCEECYCFAHISIVNHDIICSKCEETDEDA